MHDRHLTLGSTLTAAPLDVEQEDARVKVGIY